MAINSDSTSHMPGERWAFDEPVARVFADMLQRSIPQHDTMRDAVTSIAAQHLRAHTKVIDLGCSWGHALGLVREVALSRHGPGRVEFEGLEVSPAMLTKARERFADTDDVTILDQDIREWTPGGTPSSVVLAVLTLQFAPINYRQQIIRRAHDALAPGGCFIVVEKVLGEGAHIDDVLTDLYHQLKQAQGYSVESVRAKQSSLEGVLVPVTASMNESMLRGAGFREVDAFWRWMNFAAWVAIR